MFVYLLQNTLAGCLASTAMESAMRDPIQKQHQLQGAACTGKPAQITLLYSFFSLAYLFDKILDNYTYFGSDFMVFFRAEIENFTVIEYGGRLCVLKTQFILRFVLTLSQTVSGSFKKKNPE